MAGRQSSSAKRVATVEVKSVGHLVLYVRDLERSRRFYADVLGWQL